LIKGVIFDLGMTLIRFIGDWEASMERGKRSLTAYMLRNKYQFDATRFMEVFGGRLEHSQNLRLKDQIERPTVDLLKVVMTQFGYDEISDDIVEGAMRQFYNESEIYWIPMSASLQVLIELRDEGYLLGLISNAGDERNVSRLISKANLEDFFDPLLVSAVERIRKPDVRIFQKVLDLWDLAGEQVVMVGDALDQDILGAQKLGIRHIWLKENVDTLENRQLADEVKPELIAAKLSEVPEMIRKMNQIRE
jgi:HAD superfamily hydrolase (TIGR01509 family)